VGPRETPAHVERMDKVLKRAESMIRTALCADVQHRAWFCAPKLRLTRLQWMLFKIT